MRITALTADNSIDPDLITFHILHTLCREQDFSKHLLSEEHRNTPHYISNKICHLGIVMVKAAKAGELQVTQAMVSESVALFVVKSILIL